MSLSFRFASVLISICFDFHTRNTSCEACSSCRGWLLAPHRLNDGNGGVRISSECNLPRVSSKYSFSLNMFDSWRLCLVRIEGNDTYWWALIFDALLEVTHSAHYWATIDFCSCNHCSPSTKAVTRVSQLCSGEPSASSSVHILKTTTRTSTAQKPFKIEINSNRTISVLGISSECSCQGI